MMLHRQREMPQGTRKNCKSLQEMGGKSKAPRRSTRSTVVALEADNEDVGSETIMEKGKLDVGEDCADALKDMLAQARKRKQGSAVLPSKRSLLAMLPS
ncbi:hypothetical protein L7F22_040339, partial [Adiantum nelumboides]|nr:hypothetical protein [Adiantum nelumboides]